MKRYAFLFGLLICGRATGDEPRIEFNRDIRPILSDNCFSCHGPDEKTRQGGLRLDLSDAARGKLDSGKIAIVPGKALESEVIRRVLSTDAGEQMPPADSGKKLTATQFEMLQRWIAQGAEYQRHWSFVAPRRDAVKLPSSPAALSPIDTAILERLQREGLALSPEADRQRLVRRVTLDLTGAPPSLDEIELFLHDPSPDAYERLIDRLMASPRYGERMTLDWLDAARYADTHGFNNDTTRYMWRWRDWTISAFNANIPFDRFVTEQLAGDLLPKATLDQQVATGFNRNHVINSEGGIIPEEYRVEYVADRVHTTATIFLGLSMGCARCHDHKFDPITNREYYQFFAFFNQLNEQGEAGRVGNAEPMIKAPTAEQTERLARYQRDLTAFDESLSQQMVQAETRIAEWEPKLREATTSASAAPKPLLRFALNERIGNDVANLCDTLHRAHVVGKAEWVAGKLDGAIKLDGNTHVEAGDLASFERTDSFSWGGWINVENKDGATVVSRMDDAAGHRGFDLLLTGGKLTAHLIHQWPDNALHVATRTEVPVNQWKHVFATYDGSSKGEGLKLYVDGKLQEIDITHNHLTDSTISSKTLRIGRRTDGAPFKGLIDDIRIYDRCLPADEVMAVSQFDSLQDLLALKNDERTAGQTQSIVRSYLLRFDADFKALTDRRIEMDKRKSDLEKGLPSAMVMLEMPQPRSTFILKRGQYDAPGEQVQPGVPASLPAFPSGAPLNRLGLAQWLLSPDHPLTGRVAVNRAWATFFGNGLVETVEDFGSQGQWPSHLELLDWLAVEFSGADGAVAANQRSRPHWDVKRLHRSIVESATYRQTSRVSPELYERDPANKLLARGPRFRLPAETIRDSALSAAGLLSDHLGGPSVSPYQPAGLWDDVAVGADYEGTVYRQDQGEGLYRRSMYTFWKRTCPPPGLNAFDAPEREVCTARRSRTNTPLQALVLLNDPTYLEAARKLAERAILNGGPTLESRLTMAFQLALSRSPTDTELQVLVKTHQQRLDHYRKDLPGAKALVSVGESPREPSIEDAELAAWTSVMSLILNLDEAITKG